MINRPMELIWVLEYNRASYKLKHAQSEKEKAELRPVVAYFQKRLTQLLGGNNDSGVQGTKKATDTGKSCSSVRVVWRENNQGGRP